MRLPRFIRLPAIQSPGGIPLGETDAGFIDFIYYNLAANDPAHIPVFDESGLRLEIEIPYAGQVTRVDLYSEVSVIAGLIEIRPKVAGVFTNGTLNTQLNPANPDFRSSQILMGNAVYEFNIGQRIGLTVFGDLATLPGVNSIWARVFLAKR